LHRLTALPLTEEGRWRIVPMSEPAAAYLQEWREYMPTLEAAANGLLLSWIGKLPGLAVRLSLVLEMLWRCGDKPSEPEPAEIGGEAVQQATRLLYLYMLPMARRCFGDAATPQHERDAAALARWILAHHPVPERVNARELRQAGALTTKEAARYDKALAELTETGVVRPAFTRSGDVPGRPRKDYEVNPKLFGKTLNA
jgi:hypothetical protein